VRLPNTAHTSQNWRIHEIAPDFRVEDVWALPWRGDAGDFPELVELIIRQDVSRSDSRAARLLFAIRARIGEALGWDAAGPAAGAPGVTLRDRLPADLRAAPGPEFKALPFSSLYLLDDEFAAEAANRTMDGVLHLGWVPDGIGGFRGQMAVLVRPNGLLGAMYMAAIKPFRRVIVYPAMISQIERAWRRRRRPRRRQASTA
jgi:hypothetical protein